MMAHHVCEACAERAVAGKLTGDDLAEPAAYERGQVLVDAGTVPKFSVWFCEACGALCVAPSAQAVEVGVR